MVFGVGGSNGAIAGSIKSKMVAGGHLGMMALSRVTLRQLGFLVFFTAQCTLVHLRGLGIACRLSVGLSVCL